MVELKISAVERWMLIMSLNIKNEETHRLARELARLKGESVTLAVTIALRERLAREQKYGKAGLAERLQAISRRSAPLMKNIPASDKIGDLLYDRETGLPK
jgi:antitoxin VapB